MAIQRTDIIVNIDGTSTGIRKAAKTGKQALAQFNAAIAKTSIETHNASGGMVRLRATSGQYIGTVSQAKIVVAQLRAETQRLAQVEDLLTKSLGKQDIALLRTSGLMQGMRGASGSASFALLSLTQGVQDAGNFGMGMAQGIRAVNNNIQQFATAMTFAVAQSGGFGKAMKLMGKAMLGPAGLLFAFSAVSAAVEYYSNRSQMGRTATTNLIQAWDDAASSLITFENTLSGLTFRIPQDALGFVIKDLKDGIEDYNEAKKIFEKTLSVEPLKDRESFAAAYMRHSAIRLGNERILFDVLVDQNLENQKIIKARNIMAAMTDAALAADKSLLKQFEEQQASLVKMGAIRRSLAERGFKLEQDKKSVLSESEKIAIKLIALQDFLFSQEESEVGVLSVQLGILKQMRKARQEMIQMEEFLRMLQDDPASLVASLEEIKNANEVTEILKRRIVLRLEELQLLGVISEFEATELLDNLEIGKKLETESDKVGKAMRRMQSSVANGVAGMIGGFADLALGAEKNLGVALLGPLADMSIQLGKIAIATGIGMIAIKKAFEFANPLSAIAAGMALIVLGKTIKARIGATGRSIGAGSVSGSAGFSRGAGFAGFGAFANAGALSDLPRGSELGLLTGVPTGFPQNEHRFTILGRDLVTVVGQERGARDRAGVTG